MENKRIKVMIATPISQNEIAIREYLNSLMNLENNDLEIDYLFIKDNVDDKTEKILNYFSEINSKVTFIKNKGNKTYDFKAHLWKKETIYKVTGFRNFILNKALSGKYDYLFMVDADILLKKETLKHLINMNKDIISEIFWTKWRTEGNELPQVWLSDAYTLYKTNWCEGSISTNEIRKRTIEFLDELRKPGIYEVGGLGACTLISRKALEKGVSYSKIANVNFWGEDRHFCIRAAVLGIKLFVDTSYPALHVYRKNDLSKVASFGEQNGYRTYL